MTIEVIHKVTLYSGSQGVQMPADAIILGVKTQRHVITVWYETCSQNTYKIVEFLVVGTGESFEKTHRHKYLGTVLQDEEMTVWHVYEVVK